ncbi:MAG: acyl carrier protein [Lachnospiraceae bacterium]|nr:acyl carrier protein [Lachnospiraceae bacterium]
MSREVVLEKMKEIFMDVLDAEVDITEETKRQDIEEWDSIAHINIIMSVESEFGIKFTLQEVNEMTEIGKIVTVVCERA